MPSMATQIAADHPATRVRLAPLAGAIPFAFAFVVLLVAGPALATVATGVAILLAAQIGLELRLANAIVGGVSDNDRLRMAVRLVAAVRHGALLFLACLLASVSGHVGVAAVLGLIVFAGLLLAEQAAMIVAAALVGAPGLAALHLSEGTLGLAGETA